jgi:tRNA pseudouridine(55) synthase
MHSTLSDLEKKYGPGKLYDWQRWIASFFLWVRNARGDVWSRKVILWKPLGLTPLESVQQLKKSGLYVWGKKVQIPANVPIAYAGRLDPMAEGKLLLLIGEECKKIAEYRERDKTYIVEVLFGVSTDTGDLLGLVKHVSNIKCKIKSVHTELPKFIGTHEWEYPVFSSRTVQGKPLFKWFYEGRISEIEIPKRKMTFYSLGMIDSRTMSAQELLEQAQERIEKVTKVEDVDKEWGQDFRRGDVLKKWQESLNVSLALCNKFTLVTIVCRCGSGTYMRTLAEKIGEALGVPACAFSITRTQIG